MQPNALPSQDWKDRAPADTFGAVMSVRGSEAIIGVPAPSLTEAMRATVGKLMGVETGTSKVIGMITEVVAHAPDASAGFGATARLDLMGEIRAGESGASQFHRGVKRYPAIGDPASAVTHDELRLIYEAPHRRNARIGTLHQDETIGASINVDDLLAKHFVVLGSTGVGKSSGVAVILREVLEARPDMRIFLLDGHNEYGRCFGERANIVNPRNLKLPFWLFNFEELVDVVYGGRPAVAEEVEILSELIPIAKGMHASGKVTDRLALKRVDPKATGYTIDTPVPYHLSELMALIDDRMGRLENRSSRMHYHRLLMRVETIRNNPRYAFMFENANVGGDTMSELLRHLFRMEPNGKPMTIMQLAGLPVEVIDAVVCVLCRLAFDIGLWSDGKLPLLIVCEEAHRYASVDRSVGFNPTRQALSRIAKEGRKYGICLGLVTQRPAELDPTIISQCNTLFAMRMANDRDQALLRSSISDAATKLLTFVPSLGTREVIGFGEGVPLPARLTFKELPEHLRPRSDALGVAESGADDVAAPGFVDMILERWRGATLSHKPRLEEAEQEAEPAPVEASPRLGGGLEEARYRILKGRRGPGDTPSFSTRS